MSIDAYNHVWRHSRHTCNAKLVLLAIADHTNQKGEAWPSIERLATMTRMSRRNIQRLVNHVVSDELEVLRSAGPHGCNKYRLKGLHYPHIPYSEYLQTSHWKHVRKLALKRAGYRCQVCNAGGRLQVHHRTYDHLWAEDKHLSDLTVLCATCHEKHHVG